MTMKEPWIALAIAPFTHGFRIRVDRPMILSLEKKRESLVRPRRSPSER
jgi:hypothetical protein